MSSRCRRRAGSILAALVLLAAACSPSPTPVPTAESSPSAQPTPIASPTTPTVALSIAGELYAGPGNSGFSTLASLAAGTRVQPVATYVDFAQVEATVGDKTLTGFVRRSSLASIPAGTPELTEGQVPLEPLIDPGCGDAQAAHSGLYLDNTKDSVADETYTLATLDSALRVRVTGMTVSGYGGAIKLQNPPTISDPWYKGLHRMDIGSYGDGSYELQIWDGRSDQFHALTVPGVSITDLIEVVFGEPEGRTFQVLDAGGHSLMSMDLTKSTELALPDGLFPDRRMAIGTVMMGRSSLRVGMAVGLTPGGQWRDNVPADPGLAQLAAAHGMTIGTEYVDREYYDARHCRALMRDYDLVFVGAVGDVSNWLGPDNYDFGPGDAQVDRAIAEGLRIRADVLFGDPPSGIPDWLKNGRYRADQIATMVEHYVKALVGHFRGRVKEWIIANEVVTRNFWWTGVDWYYTRLGLSYVEDAFRWAHEADPDAVLILNDNNNEAPRDKMTRAVIAAEYDIVKNLVKKGVPIGGVGMQMHLLFGRWNSTLVPKRADMTATMRKFGDLGVKIYVTELDIDLTRRAGQADRFTFQADLYRDVVAACLDSGFCADITTWGISDANSWLMKPCSPSPACINEPNADPLPFDTDYNPKPAYWAVREALAAPGASSPPPSP
jgi:endo-1,4-beta-xylanase